MVRTLEEALRAARAAHTSLQSLAVPRRARIRQRMVVRELEDALASARYELRRAVKAEAAAIEAAT